MFTMPHLLKMYSARFLAVSVATSHRTWNPLWAAAIDCLYASCTVFGNLVTPRLRSINVLVEASYESNLTYTGSQLTASGNDNRGTDLRPVRTLLRAPVAPAT